MALVGMADLPFTSQRKKFALCVECHCQVHVLILARKRDGGYLTTNAVAFQKITILVKHCPKCKALVQVFPYDLGKTWFEFCDINLLWFFQSSSYTIFKYCKHVPLLNFKVL